MTSGKRVRQEKHPAVEFFVAPQADIAASDVSMHVSTDGRAKQQDMQAVVQKPLQPLVQLSGVPAAPPEIFQNVHYVAGRLPAKVEAAATSRLQTRRVAIYISEYRSKNKLRQGWQTSETIIVIKAITWKSRIDL
jgi:hypothetical protein